MKRITWSALVALLLANGTVLAGGGTFAQEAADRVGQLDPFGVQLSQNESLQHEATFGAVENEYDFMFQPWELAFLRFDRNARLGNRHEGSSDPMHIYWSQLANNPAPTTLHDASPMDIVTAAWAGPVGPGMLAVSGSFGTDSFDNTASSSFRGFGIDELDRDAYEAYVGYGQGNGSVAWGVGATLFSSSTDEVFGTSFDDTEYTSFSVQGGVKLNADSDRTWNIFAFFGQPNVENDFGSGSSVSTEEFDGDSIGVGAELNLYGDDVDWEFGLQYGMADYDVEAMGITGSDLTQDEIRFKGRLNYNLGKARLYKTLQISLFELDSELMSGSSIELFEDEATVIEFAGAAMFPVNKWFSLLAGAGYSYVDSEFEERAGTTLLSFQDNTSGQTDVRLGAQILLKYLAMDLLWKSNSSPSFLGSPSSSGGERDTVNNDEITFGITVAWGR